MKALVAQSCPTLCNSMDCNLPGSSVHGILQARILEWVAIPVSRESSQPRNRNCLLHCRCILYHLSHQGSPIIVYRHVNSVLSGRGLTDHLFPPWKGPILPLFCTFQHSWSRNTFSTSPLNCQLLTSFLISKIFGTFSLLFLYLYHTLIMTLAHELYSTNI